LEFFKVKKTIPFMNYSKIFNSLSVIFFVVSVSALSIRGLNLGIEFTQGLNMTVKFEKSLSSSQIRDLIETSFDEKIQIQTYGDSRSFLIRIPLETNNSELGENIFQLLKTIDPNVKLNSSEFVGSQIGKEMKDNGLLALIFVSLGIVIYLAMRFEWKFGLAAIIANFHDVIIILGFFALFQWEFSLAALAAVLAVLGYSVNESVVVFDRIRENFRDMDLNMSVKDVINSAITKTMSRTIITHGSTEIMVLSILIFGGPTLFYFALALTIGILFGIYSSIFIASPIIIALGIKREDLIKPEKKDKDGLIV